MNPRIVPIHDLPSLVGEHLGTTEWREITQEIVQQFGEATGDTQWIHTDPERAKNESPFGGTVAHGYYSLSLLPGMLEELMDIEGAVLGLNYGLNKVRFPAPVPVGKRIRCHATLKDVEKIDNGYQYIVTVIIEVEDNEKPAAAIEAIYRVYG
jgi:acyl dehydratase